MAKEKEIAVDATQAAEEIQNKTPAEVVEATPITEEKEITEVPEDTEGTNANKPTVANIQVSISEAEVEEIKKEAVEAAVKKAEELAACEIDSLKEENNTLKQELTSVKADLETKLAESLKNGNNTAYIELLDRFEAKIDEYAGLRRERLRKEFVTDLKEEIQKQKDLLTNA